MLGLRTSAFGGKADLQPQWIQSLMEADEAGKVTKPCEQRHAVATAAGRHVPYLMDWIQHDHRYLALGLELIVGAG